MKRSRVALSFFLGAYTMALVAVGTLDGGCLVAGDASPKQPARPASKTPAAAPKAAPAKPDASSSRSHADPIYDACWDCDCFAGAPLVEPRPLVRPTREPAASRSFARTGLRSAVARARWNHVTCDEEWIVEAPQTTKTRFVANAQQRGTQRFDVIVPQFLAAPRDDLAHDRFDVYVPQFVRADVPKFAVSRGELSGWGVSGPRAMSPLARRVIEIAPQTIKGTVAKPTAPSRAVAPVDAGQSLALRINEENDGLGERSPVPVAASRKVAPPAVLSVGILLPMREKLQYHGRVVLDPSEGAGGLTGTSWMGCPRERRDAALARRAAGPVAQRAVLRSVGLAGTIVGYSDRLAAVARLLLVDAWERLPEIDATALRPVPARTTRQPSTARGL